MGKLTALHVKNAKPGRHGDGSNLYLLVSPTGGKSWVLRIIVNGKRRDLGLGSLDLLGLADAREKAARWRKMAKAGLDPSVEDKREHGKRTTFEAAAEQYYAERLSSWKNGKHQKQWITTLRTYAYPRIGALGVDRVEADDIYAVLTPIWHDKAETARRVSQRISTVLDYSRAKGWRATEAPKSALGTLLKGLKQPKRGNFAAMPFALVPDFMATLGEGRASPSILALRFLILTAARSGEVRGLRWRELDLATQRWDVPAERMKAGRDHAVPLSRAALAVLDAAKEHSEGKPDDIVFPGLKRQPLSDMTLTKVLRARGGSSYTVHGFRSSFRDWCAESGYSNDWAEAALAHAVANQVEAAYRRTKFLEQRVNLMEAWGRFYLTIDSVDQF